MLYTEHNRKETLSAKLIIFDLDDTLVDTSDLYWKVRQAFIDYIYDGQRSKVQLEIFFEEIDTKNITIYGYHPQRYEFTMLEMCNRLNLHRSEEQLNTIRLIANKIMTEIPTPIQGAWDLLQWTQKRFRLYLMTRGTEEVQNKKIQRYHLSKYFECIEIVGKKDENKFLNLISKAGVKPSETVIIEDSIKAEINPALNIGAHAIHYQYTHHTYKWLQEHVDAPVDKQYFQVNRLEDVKDILLNL